MCYIILLYYIILYPIIFFYIGAHRAGATVRPQGGNLHAKRAVQI